MPAVSIVSECQAIIYVMCSIFIDIYWSCFILGVFSWSVVLTATAYRLHHLCLVLLCRCNNAVFYFVI